VFHEAEANFEVILLLMFMVAGIYFMKELLLFVFTRILLQIRSKLMLSLLFSFVAAFLSAFLDALTVTAVLISVGVGFYSVYHKVASGKKLHHDDHDHGDDASCRTLHREDLEQFRAFLRSLLMHGAVGTALGGVCTLVGEPQNLLIASVADWDFVKFFLHHGAGHHARAGAACCTCLLLEVTGKFGYGAKLRITCASCSRSSRRGGGQRTTRTIARLTVQAGGRHYPGLGLAMHWAEVGLIGLMVIVLLTAFNGVVEEHQLGHAFEEALPFTALLVVFFAIVAVIHDQHLFTPVIDAVLAMDSRADRRCSSWPTACCR
jgi:NhaB family Na+:H+ antiporter